MSVVLVLLILTESCVVLGKPGFEFRNASEKHKHSCWHICPEHEAISGDGVITRCPRRLIRRQHCYVRALEVSGIKRHHRTTMRIVANASSCAAKQIGVILVSAQQTLPVLYQDSKVMVVAVRAINIFRILSTHSKNA